MSSSRSRRTLFVVTAVGISVAVSALTLVTLRKETPLAIGLVLMVVGVATAGGLFIAWMLSRFADTLHADASLRDSLRPHAGTQQIEEAVIIDLKNISLGDSFHMARKMMLGTFAYASGFLLLSSVLAANLFVFAIEWSRLPAGPAGILIVGSVLISAMLAIFLLVVAAISFSHRRGDGLKVRLTERGVEVVRGAQRMSASWLELRTIEETRWGIFFGRSHALWAAIPKRLLSGQALSLVRKFARRNPE